MDKSTYKDQENPAPVKRVRILVDIPVSTAPFNSMTWTNSQGEQVELNVLQMEDESLPTPSTSSTQKIKLDSILRAVLFGMMENSGYTGGMSDFWGSDEQKNLTNGWATHVKKSKTDTEKFTPIQIFYKEIKVAMQVVDGLLRVVKMEKVGHEWKFNGWAGRNQKCSLSACISKCSVGKFCDAHAPRQSLLIQDMRATPPILALLNPSATTTPYTDSKIRQKLDECGIKKIRGGKEIEGGTEIHDLNIQLYDYVVKKRTDREETFFQIIGRWSFQDDNNKVQNSVFGGASLLNSKILFRAADLAWVKSFLNENWVTFNKGEELADGSTNPPGVSGEINRSLPYVYLGRNDEAEFYVGVQNQISLKCSGTKSPYHYKLKEETGMDRFEEDEDMPIFQSPIPTLLQHTKSVTKRSKFSPEEEDEFLKMENAANNYETLAHSAIKIGEMVGQTYKGALVKGTHKQMTHIDGAINIDDLKCIYAFLFETNLVISEGSQLEKGQDQKVVMNFVV
ncbi:uncharacterized protein LOC110845760 isoform X2 [Folsomia candida]|uniref:uncharacterized protein LOC110845760 isoform X2 n=1 Tax=Folsomia candida TaxID=158441 RepID=UPI0016054F41|nr:uncharacterized protein LOC110845760 isoform X2 [Folsomia candida]